MSAAVSVLLVLIAALALAFARSRVVVVRNRVIAVRNRAERLRQRALDRKRPGEIYIAPECCTGCGVPALLAPELFEDGAPVCRIKRQPQTATELRRALRVFRQQDLSCVRYRGGHSRVRPLLDKVGCGAHADPLPATREPSAPPAAILAPTRSRGESYSRG